MRISRRFVLAVAVGLLAVTVALSLAIPVERGVTSDGLLVGLVVFLLAPATAVASAAGLSSGSQLGPTARLGLAAVAYLGGLIIALISLVSTGRLNP